MTKFSQKTAVYACIALILSGCAINTKPDHPQIRESFAERRIPRDNSLAASGALGIQNEEGSFIGIDGSKIGNAKNDESSSSGGYLSNIFGSSSTSNSNRAPTNKNADDGSFFDRLWKKLFSENSQESSMQVAQNRHYPAENITNQELGQGSSAPVQSNYYESASDILPTASTQAVTSADLDPIHNESKAVSDAKYGYLLANGNIAHSISSQISSEEVAESWKNVMSEENPIHVAAATPTKPGYQKHMDTPLASREEIHNTLRNSKPVEHKVNPTEPEAPMARTDEFHSSHKVPSVDELRQKSYEIEPPKLTDVPHKSKQVHTAKPTSKQPATSGHQVTKPVKAMTKEERQIYTKYRDPINDVDPKAYEGKDPAAGLDYDDGKHYVRGTLGTIKK